MKLLMKFGFILSFLALAYPVLAQNSSDSATAVPSTLGDVSKLESSEDQQDSLSLANAAMPKELDGLGSLKRDLVAYFPLNDTSMGGLSWSSVPIAVTATKEVEIKQDDGRTFADFTTKGAKMVLDPPMQLGDSYTLVAWVQTPTAQNDGNIWHGSGPGCFLMIKANALNCVLKDDTRGVFAETKTPLDGWYHMAITYDGNVTQCFLNGTPLDSIKGSASNDLATIGSCPSPQYYPWARAAGINEMFIFSRCLTADEIKQVMVFSKPVASGQTNSTSSPKPDAPVPNAPDAHPFGK